MATSDGGFGISGIGADRTTVEKMIWWNSHPAQIYRKNGVVVSTTVDSGNTPTTDLRPGLVLGVVTSTNKFANYDPTATDGTEVAIGVLLESLQALDFTAVAVDRAYAIGVGGPVKAGQLIGLDQMARSQMYNRFIFDDDLVGNKNPFILVVSKTSDYTVLAADNNKHFDNKGATSEINFTMPTIARGLRYRFYIEADAFFRITSSTSDTLVAFNDAAADSFYFNTASELIGGCVELIANSDETKWHVILHLADENQTKALTT